ncbi:MAG TPA: hypothetical protein ENH23_06610, partial [candidate division Zixibacteria bacterium]|nr:hypothetical protein [candidate division Zixibacteria bacterium]
MGLDRLPYPLCFNLPSSAWDIEKKAIHLLDHTVSPCLYVDLLVETGRDLFKVDQTEARSAIAGYRFCAGISDQWFIDQVALPTVRDQGTCLYYSRWPDGYNVVGSLMDIRWGDIYRNTFKCQIGNEGTSSTFEPDLDPEGVISFLSGFTTLGKGDLISLGSLVAGKLLKD